MKKAIYFFSALFIAACNQNQEKVSPTALLISNASIIDVRSGKLIKNKQVVIDSGRIQHIKERVENVALYAQHIDAEGKYLMPGLAEMHAHIPPPSVDQERIEDILFLYLSNGITTIRGMLGDPSHLILREKASNNTILSPRIFTSSPSLNGNTVKTVQEADSKIRKYKDEGYDFLKIHPGVTLEVFDQIVQTANEVDIPFAGHVPVDVGIRHALKSKYASIDHVDGFLEGLVPPSANVKPAENGFFGFNFTPLADSEKIDELVQMSKSNQVWIVPTQSLFERWFAPISSDELLKQPEMKYMSKTTLEDWKERKDASTSTHTGFSESQWRQFDSIRRQLIKSLQEEGHGILLGSDAPQLFNVPGFSIHHEIDGMERSGLSPLEIIQSGTINPAHFFSMEDEFGEIKEGFSADFMLLRENPLENLDALQNPWGVMVRGQWLPREKIDEKLTLIAKKAKEN
ncbi:amidohydrolase family protein [Pareuzebyella sediminis]|uniref:amidohydrolase family protein n=1 Tax=Pareuzebyella sediminis TaxID=2607998 RepID=UPI0011EC43C8|nr:amidohydrolase family protein [Pareuzebyella sediminis]